MKKRFFLFRISNFSNFRKTTGFGAVILLMLFLLSAGTKMPEFNNGSDVGNSKLSGSFVYDSDKDMYTLTASGVNMWGKTDEFFMVWKEVPGDFKISVDPADVNLPIHDIIDKYYTRSGSPSFYLGCAPRGEANK